MKISIIAAIGKNRELGKDNKLLWHISEDLKRFKQLTKDHAVVMGRKTFESLGKPLPNRLNIVITRDVNYKIEGVIVVNSLEKALECIEVLSIKNKVLRTDEIFVIGGGQIYAQAIDIADKLYLTIVDAEFEADTYFPNYSQFKKVVFEQKGKASQYSYTFLELER